MLSLGHVLETLSEVTTAGCVIYIPIRLIVCVCDIMLVHIPPLGKGDQNPSIFLLSF